MLPRIRLLSLLRPAELRRAQTKKGSFATRRQTNSAVVVGDPPMAGTGSWNGSYDFSPEFYRAAGAATQVLIKRL